MNRKQFGILLVLVVVLGSLGLILRRNQSDSWTTGNAASGAKLLGNFPVNDVLQISIRRGANEVNLVKKDDLWRVSERRDYPANFSQISEFLLKVRDLKIVQSEQVGPLQLPGLQLAPPGQGTNSALVVEFKGPQDKTLKTLLLGKPHLKKSDRTSQLGGGDEGWPDGRFVKVSGSESVALISDPLENIEPRPESWLNKDFVRIEKARTVTVAFPQATNSWKLTRDTEMGDWTLAGLKPGEQLDLSKTAAFSNPLGSAAIVDVEAAHRLDPAETNTPVLMTIDTFDAFEYAIKIGVKTNDNYPVNLTVTARIPQERIVGKGEKTEDKASLDKEFTVRRQKLQEKFQQEQGFENWTCLVSSWVFDPLLKERAQLLLDKSQDGKKDANGAADGSSKPGPNENAPAPAVE